MKLNTNIANEMGIGQAPCKFQGPKFKHSSHWHQYWFKKLRSWENIGQFQFWGFSSGYYEENPIKKG